MILMPPYSPKYNPFEHTWSALKQKVAGCVQLYGAVSDALNAVYKASSYIDTSQLIVSVLRKLNQAMYAYEEQPAIALLLLYSSMACKPAYRKVCKACGEYIFMHEKLHY